MLSRRKTETHPNRDCKGATNPGSHAQIQSRGAGFFLLLLVLWITLPTTVRSQTDAVIPLDWKWNWQKVATLKMGVSNPHIPGESEPAMRVPDELPCFFDLGYDPVIEYTLTDLRNPCVFYPAHLDFTGGYRAFETQQWKLTKAITPHPSLPYKPAFIPFIFSDPPYFLEVNFKRWIWSHQEKNGEPWKPEKILAKIQNSMGDKLEDLFDDPNRRDEKKWSILTPDERGQRVNGTVEEFIAKYAHGRCVEWFQVNSVYVGIAEYQWYDKTPLTEGELERQFLEALIYVDYPIIEEQGEAEGKKYVVFEPQFSRLRWLEFAGMRGDEIVLYSSGNILLYNLNVRSFRRTVLSSDISGYAKIVVIGDDLYLFSRTPDKIEIMKSKCPTAIAQQEKSGK